MIIRKIDNDLGPILRLPLEAETRRFMFKRVDLEEADLLDREGWRLSPLCFMIRFHLTNLLLLLYNISTVVLYFYILSTSVETDLAVSFHHGECFTSNTSVENNDGRC